MDAVAALEDRLQQKVTEVRCKAQPCRWYDQVEKAGFDSFQTLAGTIYDRYDEVLNFFNDRSTNASAEAFNSKVKNFRASLRGVSDVRFFLFRLQKIYA